LCCGPENGQEEKVWEDLRHWQASHLFIQTTGQDGKLFHPFSLSVSFSFFFFSFLMRISLTVFTVGARLPHSRCAGNQQLVWSRGSSYSCALNCKAHFTTNQLTHLIPLQTKSIRLNSKFEERHQFWSSNLRSPSWQ
jgi:hypothetical protein